MPSIGGHRSRLNIVSTFFPLQFLIGFSVSPVFIWVTESGKLQLQVSSVIGFAAGMVELETKNIDVFSTFLCRWRKL